MPVNLSTDGCNSRNSGIFLYFLIQELFITLTNDRPLQISVTGAKKKTLGKLKKGKVTVKIHYKISKKEKKKDLFAYTINKKGNVKKISKSYYDSKKQTVNFTTKSFSKFAVGGRL